jgi:hypothetical protein
LLQVTSLLIGHAQQVPCAGVVGLPPKDFSVDFGCLLEVAGLMQPDCRTEGIVHESHSTLAIAR